MNIAHLWPNAPRSDRPIVPTTECSATFVDAGGIRCGNANAVRTLEKGARVFTQFQFGHGGSTGMLCWADPQSNTVFVVLTTSLAGAVDPHPRNLALKAVAEAVG